MSSGLRRIRSMIRLCLGLSVVLVPLVNCSDSGAGVVRDLDPLVGVWNADVMVVPNPENPSENLDLIEEGASYALSIIATGQFTAVFDFILLQGFESGSVEVSGNQISLVPTSPPGSAMSGTWSLQEDALIVDAIRSIDLDGDGTPEVIPFHLEFSGDES